MSNERNGDWTQTFTGLQFWPEDPRAEDVRIEDIAHALALQCRFNGHCRDFYSVAQHSVIVSSILPPELKLWGLLHDAAEAYVGDMVRPLKRGMPAFRAAEHRVMDVICERFGLPRDEPPEVKEADNIVLMTEKRDLLKPMPQKWAETADPMRIVIQPWSPGAAEHRFMAAFKAFNRRERRSA